MIGSGSVSGLQAAPSSASSLAALQQLNHQAALERRQLAAVVPLQDRRHLVAEPLQVGRGTAVGNVEQSVEELRPQVAMGIPASDVIIRMRLFILLHMEPRLELKNPKTSPQSSGTRTDIIGQYKQSKSDQYCGCN